MIRSIVTSVLVGAALMLAAGLSSAAEDKHWRSGDIKAADIAGAPAKGAKSKDAKAARVKLVDINSAGKAELKSLPGIGDAEADKIIAGRPYLSKANLATHNVISREAYEALKSRIIARQNKATAAKLDEKQKGR